jgi:hypothetical protein
MVSSLQSASTPTALALATADDQGTVERLFEGCPRALRQHAFVPPAVHQRLELTPPQTALLELDRLRVETSSRLAASQGAAQSLSDVFAQAALRPAPGIPPGGDMAIPRGWRTLDEQERQFVDAFVRARAGDPAAQFYTVNDSWRTRREDGIWLVEWGYRANTSSEEICGVSLLDRDGRELTTWEFASPIYGGDRRHREGAIRFDDGSFAVMHHENSFYFDSRGQHAWTLTGGGLEHTKDAGFLTAWDRSRNKVTIGPMGSRSPGAHHDFMVFEAPDPDVMLDRTIESMTNDVANATPQDIDAARTLMDALPELSRDHVALEAAALGQAPSRAQRALLAAHRLRVENPGELGTAAEGLSRLAGDFRRTARAQRPAWLVQMAAAPSSKKAHARPVAAQRGMVPRLLRWATEVARRDAGLERVSVEINEAFVLGTGMTVMQWSFGVPNLPNSPVRWSAVSVLDRSRQSVSNFIRQVPHSWLRPPHKLFVLPDSSFAVEHGTSLFAFDAFGRHSWTLSGGSRGFEKVEKLASGAWHIDYLPTRRLGSGSDCKSALVTQSGELLGKDLEIWLFRGGT